MIFAKSIAFAKIVGHWFHRTISIKMRPPLMKFYINSKD